MHIAYNGGMSAVLSLLRLQQVDRNMDKLENELAQIKSSLENDAEVEAARQALQAAEEQQTRGEAARLAAERQASAQRTKLHQAEASLYGGTVRNPKELQDLQADVAALKRHLQVLDDAEIRCMQELESAEADVRLAGAKMDETLARAGKAEAVLLSRQSELLRGRASLQAERSAAAETIRPAWQTTYESLRRSRRGLAVAAVGDGACAACGTALTAALQQNARHSPDIVLCPSCGRILYAD